MSEAKTMSRSCNQLATSYAPQSFFTFEGGIGACIAHSAIGESPDLAEPTVDQIFERLNELGRAWFDAALAARANDASKFQVLPVQCVDRGLLDVSKTGFQLPGQDRLLLCRPSRMEYTPAPLTFVCRRCGLFKGYDSLKALDGDIAALSKAACKARKDGASCDWEQLDVIFVHWSGHWSPAFPGQWQWSDTEQKAIQRIDNCVCGSKDFRLNRKKPTIGDWFFECAKCGKPLSTKWLQNDSESLAMLGPQNLMDLLTHVRMQATPYRASNAYYVHSDLFIDFKDGGRDLLARLRPGREEGLKDFIASRYGFGASPITEEDVKAACEGREDCAKEYLSYQTAMQTIAATEKMLDGLDPATKVMMRNLLAQTYEKRQLILDNLRERSILVPKLSLPNELVERIASRQALFAPKFDPFRLSIEHAALEATRLAVEKKEDGKKPYVSVTRLDEDLGPELKSDAGLMEREAKELLSQLGLADFGLIRKFDLCKFSFGYSRMESVPVLRDKRGYDMPVRLNLFPPVRHDGTFKHPIYIVQQGNEALYVKLKPELVMKWLEGLNCPDLFSLTGDKKIGAGLLSSSVPLNAFLDNLPESATPPAYLYVYTLLHSYSHLLMKHVSEYSGLDLGSLGEYIFPADLAFVVYRNGTTMDLGNMSAMWRNAGISMLGSMLSPKATQCGTGSLCATRGGACPDCLMVPETSCIAGNKLLSRSVLRSIGGKARFDTRIVPIQGYIDVARESLCS